MEKGEGATFTKQELRDAFPGVEQVDRRMRDLRPAGWVIQTYRERLSLNPNELYLETIGLPVWEDEHRNAGLRVVSDKLRREVFESDGFRCRRCGIGQGETYDDGRGTARLTLGHIASHKSGAKPTRENLVTECARCNEGARHLTGIQLDAEQVWDRIRELKNADKARLLAWMTDDRRPLTNVEKAWGEFRQLASVDRERLQKQLAALIATGDDAA